MQKVKIDPEVKKMLAMVNTKMASHHNIAVQTQVDLRASRDTQAEIAKKNKGWTLLINGSGTLCYAVHPRAIRIGPFTSPEYLKDVVEEHIVNYFINTLKEILPKEILV